MKVTNKSKKIACAAGTALILGSVGIGALKLNNYNNNKDYAINMVKTQTSDINKKCNFDQAYSKYLQHLNYMYYKDHSGNEFVCVSGKLNMPEKDTIEDCKITYSIDRKHNTLKFYDMTIGNMHCNQLEALELKIRAYSTYDSKNV